MENQYSEEEQALKAQLGEVAQGLLFPSETDAPFVFFYWHNVQDITPEKLLLITRNKKGTPVEEVPFQQFFEPVTREAEWMDDEERIITRRFQDMSGALTDLLTNVRVFRVGAMDIDVYIIGKTQHGASAGLCTKIVET